MTLHEAIIDILKNKQLPLTFTELASVINREQVYRKSDGKGVKPIQIRARVKKYSNHFSVINGYVILSENEKWNRLLSTNAILISHLRGTRYSEIEHIITTLFFYKRLLDLNKFSSFILLDSNYSKFKNQDFLIFRTNFINDWFEELLGLDNIFSNTFSFFEDLINSIKRLDEKTLLNLIETIREFDSKDFSIEEFGKAFEYILEINDVDNSKSDLIRTPRDIVELMTKILDPVSGSLWDPVCGTGGFLTEANRLTSNLDLFGTEINYKVARISAMNLIMNGINNGLIESKNCFDTLFDDNEYDYIIGDIPIEGGIAGDQSRILINKWGVNLPKTAKGFGVFLLLGISKLKYAGRAVFTISDSFLYRKGTDKLIRNLLLERDLIESIISLPNNILKPYTKGKASIIILNNNKPQYLLHKIKFVDLSNQNIYQDFGADEIVGLYQDHNSNQFSQIVSNYEILEFNTLNPKYYTQNLNYLRELLFKGNAKILNEVIRIQSGKKLTTNQYSSLDKEIPYIRIENLEREILDMYLSKNSIKDYLDYDLLNNYSNSLIDRECILIAKIGENLKPTYFKPREGFDKIIIHQNVIALFSKSKMELSLEYLYYQFYSDIILNQIDNYKPVSIVPFLTLNSIQELIIPYPDKSSQKEYIEIQKASIIAAERSRVDERIKRLGYEEEAEERELDIVRTISHQLRHKLTELYTLIEKAKKISKLRNLGEFKQYEDSDPILIQEDGFEKPENESLESVLSKSEEKSLFLSELLTDVENAINLKLKFESFDLTLIIKKFSNNYQNENLSIEVIGGKTFVELSKSHFKDLIETLIENAKQHSFKAKKKVYKIVFKIKPDLDRELVIVDYSNDGDPLEISQKDYISILTKSKSSSGSGIGGFYINKIIQAHGGLLKISENLKRGVRVQFELPMKQNNNNENEND